MTRTSTLMDLLPPTRSKGWPSSTRRNLLWIAELISPLTALLIKSTTSLIEPELDGGAHAMQEPVGLLLMVKEPSSVIVSTSGSSARAGGSGRTKMAIRVATTDPRSSFLNILLPPETVCECGSGHRRGQEGPIRSLGKDEPATFQIGLLFMDYTTQKSSPK